MAFDALRALDRMLASDDVEYGDGDVCSPEAAVLVLLCDEHSPDVIVAKADDEDEGDAAVLMAARVLAASLGYELVALASNEEAEA